MISVKNLLDMVATEAIEGDFMHPTERVRQTQSGTEADSFQFNYEVLVREDGTLYDVED